LSSDRAKVAVFLSGGGSNLQSLIDASKSGVLSADIALVVSSRKKALGLERAAKASIPTFVFKAKNYSTHEEAGEQLMSVLREHAIDYLALAGYLSLLPEQVVTSFRNRIVNVHPALLPKYGGKGMYGQHVHEAVIASGDSESGVSVHLVDEIYDNGRVLEQVSVQVEPEDTADSLAERVLIQEHRLYPRVLQKLIKGEYEIDD
jgi:phosphoribosylglycinamide formyltransferase-1